MRGVDRELLKRRVQQARHKSAMCEIHSKAQLGLSPSYQFQGMALTYQRSTTTTQGVAKRSARAASTIAKKAAQRREKFTPETNKGSTPQEMYPAETEESEKAHLP